MVNVRDERPASPPALPAPRISLPARRAGTIAFTEVSQG